MKDQELLTEGDVNFSPSRKDWQASLDGDTRDALQADSAVFLHQALSTPCLDELVACEGIWLTDRSGKRYMDFHGNNVHQVGYRNPRVLAHLKQQLDTLPFSPRRYSNPVATGLAQKLVSLLPRPLNRVLLAPGGTSVVGIALKLARAVTGKHQVITYEDSFHGASLDAIAAGGEEQFKRYMGPQAHEGINIPQPMNYRNSRPGDDMHYADMLEEAIIRDGQVGAFMAETVRNTDVQVPSKKYWQRVREICDKHGVLLILDEIPIAFGRTGKMFAFEHYGIVPDILCLGKGMGGGLFPIAAIVAREEYNRFPEISLGHYTWEKSPLGCAAAMGVIECIEQDHLLEKVIEDEAYMCAAMSTLMLKYDVIGDVRGLGLLWGIELVTDRQTREKAYTVAEHTMYGCLERGLSFKISQGNVLQLSPPLTIPRADLERAMAIVDEAIAAALKK